MKLEEVAEARGAVDAHQDAVLHGCAEAHGQAVGACAGPVVGRPGVQDEASTLPEDIRGASCESKERRSMRTLQGSSPAAVTLPRLCTGSRGAKTAFTCPDAETKRDAMQGLRRCCHPKLKRQAK